MTECSNSPWSSGGRSVLLYACSGRKNVAEAADKACRKLAREGFGEMACLSSLAAGLPQAIAKAQAADLNLVVDGCDNECGRNVFDRNGVRNYVQIKVTDLDVEESADRPATPQEVAVVVRKIKREIA